MRDWSEGAMGCDFLYTKVEQFNYQSNDVGAGM